jgi:hypothetical protein
VDAIRLFLARVQDARHKVLSGVFFFVFFSWRVAMCGRVMGEEARACAVSDAFFFVFCSLQGGG